MKKKTLFAALALLISALLSVSCGKADFLEGTVWVGNLEAAGIEDEGKLYFTSPAEIILVIGNTVTDKGQYSGKGKTIVLQMDNLSNIIGTVNGTIDGDKMTLHVGELFDLTFKKQK